MRALKIVRWCDGIEFFCPKKERENLCFLFLEKKIDRQSGFSIEREKREKRVRYKKMITMMMKMKAKEERSKRRRK